MMRVSLLSVASAGLFGVLSLSSPALQLASASYSLQIKYDATNWLQTMSFWTADDPTHGFVDFVSANEAQTAGMLAFNDKTNQVYMGVDHDNVISTSSRGRRSIRTQTKQKFNEGLFILDAVHIPKAICGTWPAWWSTGTGSWPQMGEIDVIEGANPQNYNVMSLHVNPGCVVNADGVKAGTTLVRNNCDSTNGKAGCSEHNRDPSTYGDGFNAGGGTNQGGVFVHQWTSSHISIWSFPRNAIPADITAGKPVPGNWGPPTGRFSGCDFSKYMTDHVLIFDTVFCGDWAGGTFSQQCPNKGSCKSYVANNPKDFYDLYWLINHIKVYKHDNAEVDAVAAAVNGTAKVNGTEEVKRAAPVVLEE